MVPRRWDHVNCPHCGEENSSAGVRCSSCSKALTIYIGEARSLPRRFGLGPLMVLVAVIALGLGVLREVPLAGVAILVLLTPAVVRTTAIVNQYALDHRPLSFHDRLATLVGSVGVMIAVIGTSLLSFAATGMLALVVLHGFASYGFQIALIFSGTVALLAGYLTARRLWPRRD